MGNGGCRKKGKRRETKAVGWNACSIGTIEVFHFSFPLEQLCIIGGRGVAAGP